MAKKRNNLTFLQPTSNKLPQGYMIPYNVPSTERAMSIGGEHGEPAYLIPSFKYGRELQDPIGEFRKTGEHLGGPFKTWQEAEKWEQEVRHPLVEEQKNVQFPIQEFKEGGYVQTNGLNNTLNNYLNNNMKQYARGGDLTRFDEGGTHEQNPNGGIQQGQAPDGSTNTVEQGETKKGDFIYSDRISLNKDLVKQFNLPAYAANKSVSDASKAIDNKFKDRHDRYAQETKSTLLDRLSQAQEYVKDQQKSEQEAVNQSMQANSQQVPDMMNGQVPEGMEEYAEQGAEQNPQEEAAEGQQVNPASPIAAFGGYQIKRFDGGGNRQVVGPIGADLTPAGAVSVPGAQLMAPAVPASAGIKPYSSATPASAANPTTSGVVGAASTAFDLGKTAFGKAAQDTSGLAPSEKVDTTGMVAGSALKGAQAGMAFGPWGAAIGGAIGLGAGLLGSGKAKAAALKNANNFSINTNNKVSDNYAAYGGMLNIHRMAQGGGLSSEDRGSDKNPYPTVSASDFAGGGRSYPIPTKADAVDALRLAGLHGRNDVKAKVYSKYPDLKHALGGPMVNDRLVSPHQISQFDGGGDLTVEDPIASAAKKIIPTPTIGQNVNFNPAAPVYSKGTPSLSSVHDKLGIDKTNTGYGTTFGPASMKAMDAVRAANKAKTGVPLGPNDYKLLGLHNNTFRYSDRFGDNVKMPSGSLNKTNPMDFYKDANIKDAAAKSNKVGQKDSSSIIGEALRYAPIAANAYQLGTLKKPGAVNYQTLEGRFKPSYVDEAQMQRIVDQEGNNQIAAITQMGGSEGATRNAILGAGLNKTKALSDAYANAAAQNRATDVQGQEFNRNTDLQNIAIRNKALDESRMDEAAYRGAKSKLISTMGTDIGHIGKEIADAKLARTLTGYTRVGDYVMRPDGTKASALETQNYNNFIASKNNSAYGGYLKINKKRK
jgi:phage gp36-like protein